MNPPGPNPYLKTKILTASPEELRLMLYEGALRFCRQARQALEARRWEDSYGGLMRAQKIVLELSTSLNHSVDPQLCAKLGGLYTYIYKLLVHASVQRQTAPLDEAVELLEYEKETWQMLMHKLADEGFRRPGTSEHVQVTGAQQTAMSSLPPRVG